MNVSSQNDRRPGTPVDVDRADRRALFGLLDDAYVDAEEGAGVRVERFFAIGGETVLLRFAGDALVSRVVRAFSHLETAPVPDPALTVRIWDSASTGRKLPLLASSVIRLAHFTYLENKGYRGELLPFCDDRFHLALHGPEILSVVDREEGTAIYWVSDSDAIPYYESGAPLRTVLHAWFGTQTRQLLHGGAVGTPEGGVLLAGKGGMGKSTAALACLDSPLSYAGDDYTLVTTEPVPYAYSLYNTAKVKTRVDLARFPRLEPLLSNAEGVDERGEKPMIFLDEHTPDKLVSGFPIKAIVIPRFAGLPECKVVEFTPEQALRALAPSTVVQLPGAGRHALRMMSRLVRLVPSYLLGFGPKQSDVPVTIQNLLSKL